MTNALKGHVMETNRGTLMVLKRLLITALSALGLGALAAGPAVAQRDGNIPAPKTFEGVLGCGATSLMPGMPTVIPQGGMLSPLDVALRGANGMGTPMALVLVNDDGTGTPDDPFDHQVYLDLIDIVPLTSDGLDCGGYIGSGYEAVASEFGKLSRLEGLVERRQKTVDDATNPSDAQLQLLERAEEDLAEAQADLDAVSMGPIFQAAIAEWRAKGAVEDSITAWNKAVGDVTSAGYGFYRDGTENGAENTYDSYVELNYGKCRLSLGCGFGRPV